MTAVTALTIQKRPLVSEFITGTPVRQVELYIDCTSAGSGDTLILSDFIADIALIISVEEMLDGAQNGGTANSWSSATLTFAGHAGSGVWKLLVLCNLT